MQDKINRKHRGQLAKRRVEKILNDENHRLYTASDKKIAGTLHVSRLTIFNIRKRLSLQPRKKRIIQYLRTIDTSLLTLKELSARTGVKYPNLYKIVRSSNIITKEDIRPIERMIQYRRFKKEKNK